MTDHIDETTPCCTGINGSHTSACTAPQAAGTTIRCFCCLRDMPSHWAALWSDKGSRCMECEGHGEPCRARVGVTADVDDDVDAAVSAHPGEAVDGLVTARVSPKVLGAIAALERAAAAEAVALDMATAAEVRAEELRKVAERAQEARTAAETALEQAVIANRGLRYAVGGREVRRRVDPEVDGMRVAAPGATTR